MRAPGKGQGNKIDPAKTDITAALSDALLQRILVALPEKSRGSCGLVCHRWLRVVGILHRSLRLLDWDFLESGRLTKRFPNLTDVDLTWACIREATDKGVLVLSLPQLLLPLHPHVTSEDKPFTLEACIRAQQLPANSLERGLAVLASGCPDLQRLRLVDVSSNHVSGASFSEWEFVSANEKGGQKVDKVVVISRDDDGFLDHGVIRDSDKTGTKDEGFRKALTDNVVDTGTKNIINKTEHVTISKTDNVSPTETEKLITSKATETFVLTESDAEAEWAKKGHGKGLRQSELGLANLGGGCPLLQELEVHQCTDETVTALVSCRNVQILKLVGTVPGLSSCSFTDVGLTILANRCRRLLRLDLTGCEASFAGIAAIGQCCLMLEELTLSSTGFQEGWIAALSYFGSLRTLRLERCKHIDRRPGPFEHIQRCSTLERLQLVCCDVRDRVGFAALLTVCLNARELEFQDCWGLDDESFSLAAKCRKVRLLSLDGCSLITAAGLEAVALACKDLQRLRVVYCGNIRDSEISPDFGNLVVMLKEFRWRPDTKSLLASATALAQTGRWFFKKS